MLKLSVICYLDNGKEFLMLYRNKKEQDMHEGKWVSVGGKFEIGESPEECAIREIKEETGLTVTKLNYQGVITFPCFTEETDWYSFVYRVKEYEGNLLKECDEGTLKWVPYEKLYSLPMWEGDYKFLNWILEGKTPFSAKFYYGKQDELLDYDVTFYE